MKITPRILNKSLVRPFYRQHAILLSFLLFMMLGAVGRANDAGLIEYHYALIRGMLGNPVLFILVLLAWIVYAGKCEQFVVQTFRRQEFSFLGMLSLLNPIQAFWWMLQVQILLFLPVLLYALIIAVVGFLHHWYISATGVVLFNLVICLAGAGRYRYVLKHPGTVSRFGRNRSKQRHYWMFFIRDLLMNRKLLFLFLKVYSCGFLFGMVVKQVPVEYDLRMIFLFYSFGLLGHGVLIHRFREMEQTRLGFYRALPVSLLNRFLQYGALYFLLFIPEIITVGWLTPAYLHYADAFLFIFFGYGVLLLLNSLLFIKFFRMTDYLKINTVIFFFLFIGVLTGVVAELTCLCLFVSAYLFFRSYYRYER